MEEKEDEKSVNDLFEKLLISMPGLKENIKNDELLDVEKKRLNKIYQRNYQLKPQTREKQKKWRKDNKKKLDKIREIYNLKNKEYMKEYNRKPEVIKKRIITYKKYYDKIKNTSVHKYRRNAAARKRYALKKQLSNHNI
jgi:hypothetical protein